jgi:hypothetical protein
MVQQKPAVIMIVAMIMLSRPSALKDMKIVLVTIPRIKHD